MNPVSLLKGCRTRADAFAALDRFFIRYERDAARNHRTVRVLAGDDPALTDEEVDEFREELAAFKVLVLAVVDRHLKERDA